MSRKFDLDLIDVLYWEAINYGKKKKKPLSSEYWNKTKPYIWERMDEIRQLRELEENEKKHKEIKNDL